VLGCTNTHTGILDKIREMSPLLQLSENQFRRVCEKIAQARDAHSAWRPRIVGGVRWVPRQVACVCPDAVGDST